MMQLVGGLIDVAPRTHKERSDCEDHQKCACELDDRRGSSWSNAKTHTPLLVI